MHKTVRVPADKRNGNASVSSAVSKASPQQVEWNRIAKGGGADCEHCPFATNGCPTALVLAVGPLGKNVKPVGVFIAESPGDYEVLEGEPLKGPTGKEVDIALAQVGLNREDLVLINAVACKPKEPKTEADMRKAVKSCNPLFWKQLENVPEKTPAFITGKWAALAAIGRTKGVLAGRGFVDMKYRLRKR